jgi:hypothetical protein
MSRFRLDIRCVGAATAAFTVLAVPTFALAGSTTPVDLQINTHQPDAVGLGETFVIGTDVGTNPDGPIDPQQFPESWSLTWAMEFPSGLTMVSGGWAGLGTPKLPNCVASCVYVMNTPATRGYEYRVKATSLGTKILHARITAASNPDPYATNDAAAAAVRVKPLRIRLRPTPAQARTGRLLVWKVTATSAISGLAIRPTGSSCAARSNAKTLLGRATAAAGNVTCRIQIPTSPTGQRLTATVTASFAAAHASLSRTFVIHG